MTIRTAACTTAIALLAGTAFFAAPAASREALMPSSHANNPSIHSKKLFLSAGAVYDAGLRRGSENSSRNAYLRGFSDGKSSEAYISRRYVVQSPAGYTVAPVSGYSPYDRDAVYVPRIGGYSSYDGYDGRSVSYGDGREYIDDRYSGGSVPTVGLMNVASGPLVPAPYAAARAAQWSYCAARYQSFDPASGTFLANDGYRYYCR
jgi:BA14K-like protein